MVGNESENELTIVVYQAAQNVILGGVAGLAPGPLIGALSEITLLADYQGPGGLFGILQNIPVALMQAEQFGNIWDLNTADFTFAAKIAMLNARQQAFADALNEYDDVVRRIASGELVDPGLAFRFIQCMLIVDNTNAVAPAPAPVDDDDDDEFGAFGEEFAGFVPRPVAAPVPAPPAAPAPRPRSRRFARSRPRVIRVGRRGAITRFSRSGRAFTRTRNTRGVRGVGRGSAKVKDAQRVKGYVRRFTTVMHTKSELKYFRDHMVLSLDVYSPPEPLVPDNNCGIRAVLPKTTSSEMPAMREQMGVEHNEELDFDDLLQLCVPHKFKLAMYWIPFDGGFAASFYFPDDDHPELEQECKEWPTVNVFLHDNHWFSIKKMPYVLTKEILHVSIDEHQEEAEGKYDYLEDVDDFDGNDLVHNPPIAESITTEGVAIQMVQCYQQKKPMIVIGAAGAGKTYSLKEGIKQLQEVHQISKERHVLIVAMGGMAAKNCGGQTCHNAFQMRPSDFEDENREPVKTVAPHTLKMIVARLKKKQKHLLFLTTFKVLVIDEICSLGYPILHAMDHVLRIIRQAPDLPFGGVWFYGMGDSLQLPPVLCNTPAHLSPCITEMEQAYGYVSYASLEDTYQKRYQDKDWARRVLPKLRVGRCDDAMVQELSKKAFPNMSAICEHFDCKIEEIVVVSARNRNKHNANMFQICKEKNPGKVYSMTTCVNNQRQKLKLCMGCKVMIQNNALFDKGVCSGSIGTIIKWEKKKQLNDGSLIMAPWVLFDGQKKAFKVQDVNSRDNNTGFWYTPLILAWSLTVNKLQGSTVHSFLAVDIEYMTGTLSQPSAFYVALSRSVDPKKVAILTRQAPQRRGAMPDYLLPKSMVNHVSSTMYHDWIQEKAPGALLPSNLLVNVIEDSFLPVHISDGEEDFESCITYCKRRQRHLLLNGQTLHFTRFCTPPTCDQHMVFMDFETFIGDNQVGTFKPYYASAIYAHSALSPRIALNDGAPYCHWKPDNHEMKFKLEFKEDTVHLIEPTDKVPVLTLAEFNALENPGMDVAAEFVEWCFKIQFNFLEHQVKRGGRGGRVKGLVNGKSTTDFLHGQNYLRMKPLQVMAFNMSGFDGSFILDYLVRTLHKRTDGNFHLYTINKGATYVCIKIYKRSANGNMFPFMLFKDVMLQVGPGSLQKHYESWVSEEDRVASNIKTKLYFPHGIMTKAYVKKVCDAKEPEVYTADIIVDHFGHRGTTKNDLKKDAAAGKEEAQRVMALVQAGEYDVKKELRRYGIVDSAMLVKLAKAADEQFIHICGVGISVMKTLANFSQYGFLCNLPISAMYLSEKACRLNKKAENSRLGRRQKVRELSRTKIYLPTNKLYEEVSEATRGGKTVCRALIFDSVDYPVYKKLHEEGKMTAEELYKAVEDCECYPDVTSMYVYNQMENEFPFHMYRYLQDGDFTSQWEGTKSKVTASGHLSLNAYRTNCNKKKFWEKKLKSKAASRGYFFNAFCFVEVDILCNPHALEPIFARKSKDTDGKCHWDSGLYEKQWLCCVDILTLLEGGAVIITVHQVIEWAATAKLFDTWANKCFKMKQKADEENNAAMRQCGKTIGNATYGIALRKAVTAARSYLNGLKRPGEVVGAEELQRAERGSGVDIKLDEFSILLRDSFITSVVNYDQWVTKEHGPLIVDHQERSTYEDRKHLSSGEEYDRAKKKKEAHLLDYKIQDIDTPMDPAKTQYMRSLNFIGAGILAHSRRLLASIISTACPEDRDISKPFLERLMLSPAAGDTDSLVIRPLGWARLASQQMKMDEKLRRDPVTKQPMSYIGKAPGQSNDELYGKSDKWDTMKQICKITFHVILACKCYYIEYITPNGEEKNKCKIRGIPPKYMQKEFLDNRRQIFTNLLMIQRDPVLLLQYYRMTGAEKEVMTMYDHPDATDDDKNNLIEKLQLGLTLVMVQKKANFTLFRMKKCREHLNSKQVEKGVKPLNIYWEESQRCMLKTKYNGRKMVENAADLRVLNHFMPTVPLSYSGEGMNIMKDLSWEDYKKTTLVIGSRGRAAMLKTDFKDCYVTNYKRYEDLKKLRDEVLQEEDKYYDQAAEEAIRVLHLQEEVGTLEEGELDLTCDEEMATEEELREIALTTMPRVEKNIQAYCGKHDRDEGHTTIYTDAPDNKKKPKPFLGQLLQWELIQPVLPHYRIDHVFDHNVHGNQMAYFNDDDISANFWDEEKDGESQPSDNDENPESEDNVCDCEWKCTCHTGGAWSMSDP